MIPSGKLIHRVTVMLALKGSNSRKDTEYTYVFADPVDEMVGIEPLAGRELVVAKQLRADLSYKISMRYRADINHLSKLVWNDDGGRTRTFQLGPAVNTDLRNRVATFYAYEIK